jgi:hypothetical protein
MRERAEVRSATGILVMYEPTTSRSTTLRFAVHAYVVHDHLLRECRRRIRIAGPRSTDRDVEQEKERVIEDPLRAGRQIRGGQAMILAPVNEPTNFVRPPRDRKDVKVVGPGSTR